MLHTERLTLSRFTVHDADFILGLLNEPSFHRFIGDRGIRVLDDANRYILDGPVASYEQHGFGLYRVALTDSNVSIGMCGLLKRPTLDDVDIGFAFLSAAWGNGYAIESAMAVVEHAKNDVGLTRLAAIVSPENAASRAVLARLGFMYERTTRLTAESHDVDVFGRML
ncbi:MAG: GCN5-related N-acetyltransferase [Gemmatimonadetes bacterium]|nr:GCN5-related N-acetyltransferase [Gemmatimonadota bacterium]